jgi:hypothetical protein
MGATLSDTSPFDKGRQNSRGVKRRTARVERVRNCRAQIPVVQGSCRGVDRRLFVTRTPNNRGARPAIRLLTISLNCALHLLLACQQSCLPTDSHG